MNDGTHWVKGSTRDDPIPDMLLTDGPTAGFVIEERRDTSGTPDAELISQIMRDVSTFGLAWVFTRISRAHRELGTVARRIELVISVYVDEPPVAVPWDLPWDGDE